jgi:hypothetical protein
MLQLRALRKAGEEYIAIDAFQKFRSKSVPSPSETPKCSPPSSHFTSSLAEQRAPRRTTPGSYCSTTRQHFMRSMPQLGSRSLDTAGRGVFSTAARLPSASAFTRLFTSIFHRLMKKDFGFTSARRNGLSSQYLRRKLFYTPHGGNGTWLGIFLVS